MFGAAAVLAGCGDDDEPVRDRGDAGGAAGHSASGTDARVPQGGSEEGRGGSGTGGPSVSGSGSLDEQCAEANRAFTEFVAAHRACTKADDCVVIGDCGPNADFKAVQASVELEARALQQARSCGGAYDGPMFDAVCRAGKCDLQMRTDVCCGCQPRDMDGGD